MTTDKQPEEDSDQEEEKKEEEPSQKAELLEKDVIEGNGTFPGLEVMADKSRNKFVTKVKYLENFFFDIKEFQKYCSTKFACSVSTENYNEGKFVRKQDRKKMLILHGNVFDDFCTWMITECKIPEKYVHRNDKMSKKKKSQMRM